MKAVSLFAALGVAHALMILGRDVPLSVWTLPAYLWQDALVAMVFAGVDSLAGRSRYMWAPYGVLVGYAALNAGIARVLPSPLTGAMIRAARGPLADSVRENLTFPNLAVCFLVVLAGVGVPILIHRSGWRPPAALVLPGVALVALGPHAVSAIPTRGWHRNAIGALVPTSFSSSVSPDPGGDWRESPFETSASTGLGRYRGMAAGRNVLIVVLESAGAGYLGPWQTAGSVAPPEADPMPHVSRLALRSIVFESAYAVYPESIKGLFSILCSRHAAPATGVEAHAAARCDSLAGRFGEAGYRTALFHSGRFAYLGMREILDPHPFDVLADAGAVSGRLDSSFGVAEASTVTAMLEWLDGLDAGDPFFLAYLPVAGHHPYATSEPGPFAPTDERRRYLNALHEADAALGTLLGGLEERGLLEDTLVVVFGDHAEAFGQHEGNVGHSFFLYDENVRVPFLISVPGAGDPIRVEVPVSLVDVGPTILDLAGIRIPASYEGRSVVDGPPGMPLLFTDYSLQWLGLRDGCWKYLLEAGAGRSELYHVCTDPAEAENVAWAHADRVEAYRARLEAWSRAQRAAISEGE